jgi:hypothetical protein
LVDFRLAKILNGSNENMACAHDHLKNIYWLRLYSMKMWTLQIWIVMFHNLPISCISYYKSLNKYDNIKNLKSIFEKRLM